MSQNTSQDDSTSKDKQPALARQVLKFKRISKPPAVPLDLQLEKIMGITSKGKNSFCYNPITGDLAYPAGSITIIYNPKLNKQVKYFFTLSKKPVTALTFSPDGKYIAIACKGLEIAIWDMENSTKKPNYLLKGHRYGIENILFSPNMKYLVSIGDFNDRGLFVWSWKDEIRLTMNKISKKINSALFTSSGQYLVTAGDQHLKFWNFDAQGNIVYGKTKEQKEGNLNEASITTTTTTTTTTTNTSTTSTNVNIIEGKSAILGKMGDKAFMDIAYNNGQVFAITYDGVLCIVNESNRALEKWMDLKVNSGFGVLVTENYLVCGCGDGFIRFFKLTSMEHIFVLPKPPSLGSYNVERGTTRLTTGPHEKYADTIAIAFDDKNNKLASLYSDRTLFVWDLKNTDKIVVHRSFLNHSGAIYDIQILPALSSYEVSFFATGSQDKTVRVWHQADSENKEHEKIVKKNVYCKNLSRILYMNEIYDHFKYHHGNSEVEKYLVQDYQIRCIKCSSDGRYLACGDQAGCLRIYELNNFELEFEMKAHDQEILCLDFSPENDQKLNFLATGSRDRLLHIYDANKDFNILTTLDDHTSSISSLKIFYDKSIKKLGIVSCGADKSMIIRYYNKSQQKLFETSHIEVDKASKFHSLELNQEHSQIVAGQDKKISIWQIETGKQKCIYETKDEELSNNSKHANLDNVKILTDVTGSYIATSNKDGNVRIRDYYSGNLIAKMNCGDFTTGFAITQNNKNLITTTSEGCIQIWKLPEEMISNMNKKKNQLGIIVNKLSEFLKSDEREHSLLKDFKIDSLLIEKELKEYISRQSIEQKSPINNNNNQFFTDPDKSPSFGVKPEQPQKQESNQSEEEAKKATEDDEPTTQKPYIKPTLALLNEGKESSSSIDEKERTSINPNEKQKLMSNLVDADGLPSWARTGSIVMNQFTKNDHSYSKEEEEVEETEAAKNLAVAAQKEERRGKWGQRPEKQAQSSKSVATKAVDGIDIDDININTSPDKENKVPNAEEILNKSPTKLPRISEDMEEIEENIDVTHGKRGKSNDSNKSDSIHLGEASNLQSDVKQPSIHKRQTSNDDEQPQEEYDDDFEYDDETSATRKTQKNNFITENYDDLDQEKPTTSPQQSPFKDKSGKAHQSHSSQFLQRKSIEKEVPKAEKVDVPSFNEKETKSDTIEEKIPTEIEEDEDGTPKMGESKEVIRYKRQSENGRESLFDVNAIKNQVSFVNKAMENLESQLLANSTQNRSNVKADFSGVDDDVEEQEQKPIQPQDLPKQTDFNRDSSSPMRAPEKSVSPAKQKPSPQMRDQTPDKTIEMFSDQKGTPKSKDLSPNNNEGNQSVNSSGVLLIDKSKLVPTTLDELLKKHGGGVATSQVIESEKGQNDSHRSKGSKHSSPISNQKEERKGWETRKNQNTTSDMAQQKPPVSNHTPNRKPKSEQGDTSLTTERIPESSNSPFLSRIEEDPSHYIGNESLNLPSKFMSNHNNNDWNPSKQISNPSAFSESPNVEAELEQSFQIINLHLKKIDSMMNSLPQERNEEIRSRLVDKFDRGVDETRRSMNILSSRTPRSANVSVMNDSSMLSDIVINSSRDLLENYSKMLMQTFEKNLKEKMHGGKI